MGKCKSTQEFERCWSENWEQGYCIRQGISNYSYRQIKHCMHVAFLAGVRYAIKQQKQ